jgi:hypothetical protein
VLWYLSLLIIFESPIDITGVMKRLRSTGCFVQVCPNGLTPKLRTAYRRRVLPRPVAYADEVRSYVSPSCLHQPQSAPGGRVHLPAYALLKRLVEPQQLEQLVSKHPALMQQPLGIWLEFLAAYGVPHAAVRKLVLQCPELFINTNIYAAG